ncbi:mannose-1-phosphate guanylyltransferase/mannose-6-phosphate isomerase [Colwelliaceae bacterium BS250]
MIQPVILAGGNGTRLWPLSRQLYPKQFLKITSDNSLLQNTITRLNNLSCAAPITICGEAHRFIVAEQLMAIEQLGPIILEPVGRNTAPAVALAALLAVKNNQDPILLVLPADHEITDEKVLSDVIESSIELAESGKLVTFGIVPSKAETGYGYIKKLDSSAVAIAGGNYAYQVDEFVEKPNASLAEQYVQSGDFLWNSGMFMFKASCYLEELKQFRPDIYQYCQAALAIAEQDLDFLRVPEAEFAACPSESIDYAVMENTNNAVVVPLNAGWSDIGSFSAIWELKQKDANMNVHMGDVMAFDSTDNFVMAENRLVATVGLHNTIVIQTKDSVLVAAKDKVQDVKNIVKQLVTEQRSEAEHHRQVFRPWGNYDCIDAGPRDQVKRITVLPGEKLSMQMHNHRAEHWIVVSGTAKVTNGENTFLLSENESTYIPAGTLHALENPGVIALELIEVQTGSYLGEDDIVRFEDRYGRS